MFQDNTLEFEFKKNLNRAQYEAVTADTGIVLVIAGAGSGKTRVITTRVAHLMFNKHINPASIVALTFTNKAAQEMKNRILSFGEHYPFEQLPFLGTFHSYCLRLLKKNAFLLPDANFSILDEEDQLKMLHKIISETNSQGMINAKRAATTISHIKNNSLTSTENYLESDPFLKDLFYRYETERKACKALDFDDLLLETVKLFKNNVAFKTSFQENIKHILIDEYQDTNLVQHQLLNHMAKDNNANFRLDSLCVVGDEDQAIYSWRGATIANIQYFEKSFPQTKVIKLEQNYRSAQPILSTANQLIRYNSQRHEKKLWSTKKGSNCITIIDTLSDYQEGNIIAEYLSLAQEKHSLSKCALIYRNHYQSRILEESLIKKSIPYKIIGGIQFYERKEVKDILAYLKIICNPFDRISFFRILNCPPRRLGKKCEDELYALWQKEPFLDFQALLEKYRIDSPSLYTNSLESLYNLFTNISSITTPEQATEYFLEKIDYFSYLYDHYEKDEALTRIDNIKELLKAMKFFEGEGINTLPPFLDHVALLQDHSITKEQEKEYVTLMTLHAAKGLEFETIIIPGLEEGILPSSRSLDNPEALEEERRLFYVGITRAKERLLLFHSHYRATYGRTEDQILSRFLHEISNTEIHEENFAHKDAYEIKRFLNQLLGFKRTPPLSSPIAISSTNKREDKIKTNPQANALWKINQPVSHQVFGTGIIKKIETKHMDKTYLTIQFKDGQKKIDERFIKSI